MIACCVDCEQLLRLVMERDAASTATGIRRDSSWDAVSREEQSFDQAEFHKRCGSGELTGDETATSAREEGDGSERHWGCSKRCQLEPDAHRDSPWWAKTGTEERLRAETDAAQLRQAGAASCVIQLALQSEEGLLP